MTHPLRGVVKHDCRGGGGSPYLPPFRAPSGPRRGPWPFPAPLPPPETIGHAHQERSLDPADVPGPRDDRAPSRTRRCERGHLVRGFVLRLRHRVSPEFKVFTNVHSRGGRPEALRPALVRGLTGGRSASSRRTPSALARTLEYFRIPRDILVVCVGKSTYARLRDHVNVTPLEPTWEGYLTLEISNTTPLPAKIYAKRGNRPAPVLPWGTGNRSGLRGSEGEVPGAGGGDAAEALRGGGEGRGEGHPFPAPSFSSSRDRHQTTRRPRVALAGMGPLGRLP